MKLTVSRLFDSELIIKSLVAAKVEGAEPFIKNMAELADQLIRALGRRLSLADNIDCIEKSFLVKSGVPIVVQDPDEKRRVRHMIPTRSSVFTNPVTSLAWQYLSSGELQIMATLPSVSTETQITVVMFY